MGAFIVRDDIAKAVGFNNICFNADGIYAQECSDYCKKNSIGIVYIPKPLFIHN
jgi:hypothetical protein